MTDIRNGMAIRIDGDIYFIQSFQHTHMGRGGATLRLKVKHAKTGLVKEVSFKDASLVEEVRIDRKPATYSYADSNFYHFLDSETYEDIMFNKEDVKNILDYLKEGLEVNLMFVDNVPLSIELPNFVELEVVETDPGLKGDTASGGSKPAKLETGKVVAVPLFINVGDVVKIDTRNNKYIERVNK